MLHGLSLAYHCRQSLAKRGLTHGYPTTRSKVYEALPTSDLLESTEAKSHGEWHSQDIFTAQTPIHTYRKGWDLARMVLVPSSVFSDSKPLSHLLHIRMHTSMLPKPNTGFEQIISPIFGLQKMISLTCNCFFENALVWSYTHGIQATRWCHLLKGNTKLMKEILLLEYDVEHYTGL